MCAPSCNAIDEPAAGIGCDSGRPGPRPPGAPAGVQNRSRDFVELKLRLAERVRFELTSPVRGCRFSRPVHSTALPPLQIYKSISYSAYRILFFIDRLGFYLTRAVYARYCRQVTREPSRRALILSHQKSNRGVRCGSSTGASSG